MAAGRHRSSSRPRQPYTARRREETAGTRQPEGEKPSRTAARATASLTGSPPSPSFRAAPARSSPAGGPAARRERAGARSACGSRSRGKARDCHSAPLRSSVAPEGDRHTGSRRSGRSRPRGCDPRSSRRATATPFGASEDRNVFAGHPPSKGTHGGARPSGRARIATSRQTETNSRATGGARPLGRARIATCGWTAGRPGSASGARPPGRPRIATPCRSQRSWPRSRVALALRSDRGSQHIALAVERGGGPGGAHLSGRARIATTSTTATGLTRSNGARPPGRVRVANDIACPRFVSSPRVALTSRGERGSQPTPCGKSCPAAEVARGFRGGGGSQPRPEGSEYAIRPSYPAYHSPDTSWALRTRAYRSTIRRAVPLGEARAHDQRERPRALGIRRHASLFVRDRVQVQGEGSRFRHVFEIHSPVRTWGARVSLTWSGSA